ncbi:MAG: GNAT family protein [Phycisphaerae bacterium]|nr:GNAT family protein [Phycisphaerae bacterium]
MKIEPVALVSDTGRVRVEPLRMDHAPALFAAIDDADTWRWRPDPRPRDAAEMQTRVAAILDEAARGLRVPFVIRVRDGDGPGTEHLAGSTSFLDLQPGNRALEIGWTIIGPRWRRTFVNSECKLMLLTHCFETLGCIRVGFRIDARNDRSRRAVERLGAVEEGVLRKNKINHDGYLRDTVCYSILAEEWPAAKAHIASLIRP